MSSRRQSVVLVFAAAMLAMLSPRPGEAAEPSFDCTAADGAAEEAICSSEDLAALDLELARVYRLAHDGPTVTNEEQTELAAIQRGWIKGRNDCWKGGVGLEACIAASYVTRIDEIRTTYVDAREEDDAGESLGPFVYRCEGLDGPVSAVYVNAGEPPRASLRWVDRWLVMTLARTASGSNYEAEADGGVYSFWIKGGKARFARPGETDLDCASSKAE